LVVEDEVEAVGQGHHCVEKITVFGARPTVQDDNRVTVPELGHVMPDAIIRDVVPLFSRQAGENSWHSQRNIGACACNGDNCCSGDGGATEIHTVPPAREVRLGQARTHEGLWGSSTR